MKTRTPLTFIFLTLLSILTAAAVYADDACMQLCKEKNRIAVKLCNYPEKEPQALRQCLADARDAFDACKQACGK